ncbi:MAG: TIGR00282 family metallophosphoesterase, partial [Candidatus Kappaea frigidicola]|nr:TIGR00282 family metallophosphoesterase [Candidatus Kappaea frigidicola]
MKILAIGDVVGKPGRQAVKQFVGKMKKKNEVDFVIANGENSAGGSGYTDKTAMELLASNVDVITSGDHVFKKKDILSYIDKEDRLLRPANYPIGIPGCGYIILPFGNDVKVAVVNILGRVFLKPLRCPFKTMEALLDEISKVTPNIIVDFHAEATSEKIAMGWFLDGKVSAVVGTHTHVQTS